MVPSGIAANTRACGYGQEHEYSRHQRVNCSPSVVSIWSNFVPFPRCHTILEDSLLTQLGQMYLTGQVFEALDSLWHPVPSCSFRTRDRKLYFFWFQLDQTIVVHSKNCSSLFIMCGTELITPIRNGSVDTELIYRMTTVRNTRSVFKESPLK